MGVRYEVRYNKVTLTIVCGEHAAVRKLWDAISASLSCLLYVVTLNTTTLIELKPMAALCDMREYVVFFLSAGLEAGGLPPLNIFSLSLSLFCSPGRRGRVKSPGPIGSPLFEGWCSECLF